MPRMTQADYIAFLARTSQAAVNRESRQGCDDEAELQQQIVDECQRRQWLCFRGSMAHRTYRVPGEPDFIIIGGNPMVLLVECKTRCGKLSTDQRAIAAWANKLGWTVHVVRSFEEFMDIVRHYLQPNQDGQQTNTIPPTNDFDAATGI